MERIRRDSDHSLQELADHLDDTPPPRAVSVETFSSPGEAGCSLYHERICRPESSASPASLSSVLGSDCERVPVRLCAEHCQVREGPVTCKTLAVTTEREQPVEQCQIRPRNSCRMVRRLQPHLVPQTRCALNPREICHLKFVVTSVRT